MQRPVSVLVVINFKILLMYEGISKSFRTESITK